MPQNSRTLDPEQSGSSVHHGDVLLEPDADSRLGEFARRARGYSIVVPFCAFYDGSKFPREDKRPRISIVVSEGFAAVRRSHPAIVTIAIRTDDDENPAAATLGGTPIFISRFMGALEIMAEGASAAWKLGISGGSHE